MIGKSRGKDSSQRQDEKNDNNIMDSDFILLDDLVYAPLHALAKSNQQLRAHVIEAIKDMGNVKQNGQEEIVHLKNINIAYDQIRPEAETGYSVDNLQLQVPLMSIVPITNLNVEKAQIGFSAEIRAVNDKSGKAKINARICSPEQRDSDFLPRVSYDMQVKSIPATEGILRLTDILSSNQVAKQLDTTPITSDGTLSAEEQKNTLQTMSEIKAKIKKLKALYQKIDSTIEEQEKLYQLSKDNYAEETYVFDKSKYLKAQSDIANQIMECQEQLMDLELQNGLEKNE
jgi:hypothetical protein